MVPRVPWGYSGGMLRGHLFLGKFATDTLATWSIFRGLGAVENTFFDPCSGWEIVGGNPRGHLSFMRIFDSIQNLTSDYLQHGQSLEVRGQWKTPFLTPPEDGKLLVCTQGVI